MVLVCAKLVAIRVLCIVTRELLGGCSGKLGSCQIEVHAQNSQQ